MVEKNKLLSDLLDDRCDSNDLDDLLKNDDVSESWYRYHAVSAIIKDQHSASSSFEFCSQISAKISDEPAIIAAPKVAPIRTLGANVQPVIAEFKRTGSGFAIAATVAVATFFSFQTLQVAQDATTTDTQVAAESNDLSPIQNSGNPSKAVAGYEFNASEQYELDIFNDRYIRDLRRSDKGSIAPVSGEFVRTVRFSAEEWQAILESSLERQRELEKAKLQENKK